MAMRCRCAWLACPPRARQNADLFPEMPEVLHNAADGTQRWEGRRMDRPHPAGRATQQQPQHPCPWCWPRRVQGSTPRPGYRADLTVQGPWPAVAAKAGVARTGSSAQGECGPGGQRAAPCGALRASSLTLTAALLGALLGGLILNLAPRVFPVLAIKVVGFTRHAQDRRAHRISGLAYTAGWCCRSALGALMLGLRAAGEAGLGLSVAVARRGGGAGRAVHPHRAESGRGV